MSAVAALAVASPCAYFLVYESTETTERPEHHEFKQAAVLTDLPGELMSALSQGLSQFGINIPPVPSLTGSGDASTGLTGPGLTSPGLTSPGLTSPGLTDPALTSPGLTPTPARITRRARHHPGANARRGGPTRAPPNPALTSPTGATPGLTSPTGLDPALGGANEIPITTPVGLDPGADGTYPILGDPTLGTIPSSPATTSTGGGGLVNDVMQVANELGASQAIDLLKGVLMPSIMQAVQNGGAAAPAASPPVPPIPAAAAVPPTDPITVPVA
ncbi:hypothetical protein MRGA327_23460 [Mycobacterium tuberculosis RGTB327]|nr:hypothetical protein MRGA327_23460 [Mycobacterium tuberculosis RGTB327]